MDISGLIPIARRAAAGQPATHALVIGVSRYLHFGDGPNPTAAGQSWSMEQLTAAAGSASEIAAWLATEYRNDDAPIGSLRVLLSPGPKDRIHPLISRAVPAADHANVKRELIAFRRDCERNSANVGVVYIAGHGVQLTKDEATVLLEDAGADDQLTDLERAIDVVGCHRGMDYAQCANRQFWFVDACRQRPDIADRFETMAGALMLDEPSAERGNVEASPIFLAAGPRQVAFARPGERTLFCEAFLECVRGGAVTPKDARCDRWHVSSHGLDEGLKRIVAALAGNEGESQQVHLRSRGKGPYAVLHHCDPPRVSLTIALQPSQAIGVTSARLRRSQQDVAQAPAWPITIDVEAGLYQLRLTTTPPFTADEDPEIVDVNPRATTHTARVR